MNYLGNYSCRYQRALHSEDHMINNIHIDIAQNFKFVSLFI